VENVVRAVGEVEILDLDDFLLPRAGVATASLTVGVGIVSGISNMFTMTVYSWFVL
jgi:hypothetical protein